MPSKKQTVAKKVPFTSPKDGAVYTSTILERCRNLMRSGIWSGIEPSDITRWMTNFQSDAEKYFGACLLDSLIYRSELQTSALMREIFDRELPTACRQLGHKLHNFNFNEYLKKQPREDRPLMIVPVIRSDDPPTKSGPMIARMLKRRIKINEYHIAWPWQISKWRTEYNTHSIIFVDDLMGTGVQFESFMNEFNITESIDKMDCFYCPLVGHQKGVAYIQDKFPMICITPVEKLDSALNIFDEDSEVFNDGLNSPATAKELYLKILRRTSYSAKGKSVGFGNLGLLYAFQHGTPNNSLPILWYESPTWKPLLRR